MSAVNRFGVVGPECPGCEQRAPSNTVFGNCRVFHIRVGGAWFERIRVGKGVPVGPALASTWTPASGSAEGACPDCGVRPIGFHHIGCSRDPCPRCDEAIARCACPVVAPSVRAERGAEVTAAPIELAVGVLALVLWRATGSVALLAIALLAVGFLAVSLEVLSGRVHRMDLSQWEVREWRNLLIVIIGVVYVDAALMRDHTVDVGTRDVGLLILASAGLLVATLVCWRLDPPGGGSNFRRVGRAGLPTLCIGTASLAVGSIVARATGDPGQADWYSIDLLEMVASIRWWKSRRA